MAFGALTRRTAQPSPQVERTQDTPVFVPRVDIIESESSVLLVADMPGVDKTSVNIDLEGNELTIRGSFRPTTPDGYALYYHEYENGDYERSFTLSETIDQEQIGATMRDGILRLILPKAKKAQPKRIDIKAG